MKKKKKNKKRKAAMQWLNQDTEVDRAEAQQDILVVATGCGNLNESPLY